MNNIILFTGLKDGVGKTLLSFNVAYLLYEIGYSVLLIDLDFKHRELTKKIYKNRAILKNIEYNNKLYKTLDEIISLKDETKDSEKYKDLFDKLYLPLYYFKKDDENKLKTTKKCYPNKEKNTQKRENKINVKDNKKGLYLLPSYYRDPSPFWEFYESSNFIETPNSFIFKSLLDFFKEIFDFIIVDSISVFNKYNFTVYKEADTFIFVTLPSNYLLDNLNDFIDYLNIYLFNENSNNKKYIVCKNMVFSIKNLLNNDNEYEIEIPFNEIIFKETEEKYNFLNIWDILKKNKEESITLKEWSSKIIELTKNILNKESEIDDIKKRLEIII